MIYYFCFVGFVLGIATTVIFIEPKTETITKYVAQELNCEDFDLHLLPLLENNQ